VTVHASVDTFPPAPEQGKDKRILLVEVVRLKKAALERLGDQRLCETAIGVPYPFIFPRIRDWLKEQQGISVEFLIFRKGLGCDMNLVEEDIASEDEAGGKIWDFDMMAAPRAPEEMWGRFDLVFVA
jgi:hypothetical protein